jgi:hypothetical protein
MFIYRQTTPLNPHPFLKACLNYHLIVELVVGNGYNWNFSCVVFFDS